MSSTSNFTIRVYGILIRDQKVLLSRENIQGAIYTKFPGGGLEYGEGIIDCLQREIMEELEVRVEQWELFHINESFLSSAFHSNTQVVSVYYKIDCGKQEIKIEDPDDLRFLRSSGDQVLFWKSLNQLTPDQTELPVDKEVVMLLQR